MMYREKIESMLDTLDSKLKVLQGVSNGTIKLSTNDINFVIESCIKLKESIKELISIER